MSTKEGYWYLELTDSVVVYEGEPYIRKGYWRGREVGKLPKALWLVGFSWAPLRESWDNDAVPIKLDPPKEERTRLVAFVKEQASVFCEMDVGDGPPFGCDCTSCVARELLGPES